MRGWGFSAKHNEPNYPPADSPQVPVNHMAMMVGPYREALIGVEAACLGIMF